ncbi:MATE family efflux transporter [Clostridium bornimense]|uniref:MATE family efflux transporter n=1 Tax=Clostridium bornimense TaxID=1216932 RepID=UPI001C108E85|nr:MATE family efflux transporter [Clostridium bornimense]MBU5317251.1 MATE family efflux transporter [Clostridium bornimense]
MEIKESLQDGNKAFEEGSVSKVLFKFALPIIIALLVSELYNMVDSLYIGQVVGANGIGALTIAFPIQRLFLAIAMLVSVGASTAVAKASGEGNLKKIQKIIPTSITLVTMLSAIVLCTIYLFEDKILISLGASSNTLSYAKTYVSIILIGLIFNGFTLVVSYILTALGNSKITLISTSIGAIANIIIDYILIVVFDFGIAGAAISTAVSQLISSIYAFYQYKKAVKGLTISFSLKSIEPSMALTMICVGFSTFVIEISDAIVSVILNNLLLSSGGDVAIVAIGLITRVSMFLFVTVIGVSSAMQPMAAYNYGAKNFTRLYEIIRKSIISVTVTTSAVWFFIMLFTKEIMSLFVTDTNILNTVVPAFRTVVAIFPIIGVYYVAIYYYQAMGNVKSSFLLSIYRQIIIFIPIVFILVKVLNLGVFGAWISFPISDAISFITSLFYVRKAYSSLDDMIETEKTKKKVRKAAIATM